MLFYNRMATDGCSEKKTHDLRTEDEKDSEM